MRDNVMISNPNPKKILFNVSKYIILIAIPFTKRQVQVMYRPAWWPIFGPAGFDERDYNESPVIVIRQDLLRIDLGKGFSIGRSHNDIAVIKGIS